MSSILISPHDDDSHLFASFTLLREKSIVVVITDGYIQFNRGDIGCSAEVRAEETRTACEVTGNPVIRLGLKDSELDEASLLKALQRLSGFETVYTPAIQGGNWQHDLISKVAKEVFGNKCIEYTTYTKTELWTKGNTEIIPTQEEIELKNKALDCYKSQLNLGSTRPHFEAVRGKSEWLI